MSAREMHPQARGALMVLAFYRQHSGDAVALLLGMSRGCSQDVAWQTAPDNHLGAPGR